MRRINIRQWMVILLSGFLQYPVTGVDESIWHRVFRSGLYGPNTGICCRWLHCLEWRRGIPQTMLLKYLGILIGVMFITYILEWKKGLGQPA